LASVRAAILQNPTEHGFATALWTLKRVGVITEQLHEVRFTNICGPDSNVIPSACHPDAGLMELYIDGSHSYTAKF
jgi:hypothetical protein